MMAEAQEDDDEVFVYMGGDQEVPRDVRRVRIDKSVKIIPSRAFSGREHLIYVEFHDGIEIVEFRAFYGCTSLMGSIKLLGIKFIEVGAFHHCDGLTEIEFGDTLQTIGEGAFELCISLRTITMPCVRSIGKYAFVNCRQLTDLELPEGLETLQQSAFHSCVALRRIAMPLRDNIIEDYVFFNCPELTTVDLVGRIHNIVASLHLDSWRNEMKEEINRINQTLPTSRGGKTAAIQQWIRSVIHRLNHCKAEHKALLKEATTLLELALWKAKIGEKEEFLGEVEAKRVKMDIQSERNERRITSGANIVIKNVLPFLELN